MGNICFLQFGFKKLYYYYYCAFKTLIFQHLFFMSLFKILAFK